MPRVLLFLVGTYGAAGLVLFWPRLRPAWRRRAALTLSAAGLGFLVLAMGSEGLRESASEMVFLVGTRYVTGQTAASASLPYYVLSAACLLLGTAGLALDDQRVRGLARHWLATATLLSLLVVLLRFLLEKAAAPYAWSQAVGVVWLAPLVGASFAVSLRAEGKALRHIAASLLVYAVAVRGFVTLLYLAATRLGLGTHYDLTGLARVESPISGRVLEFTPGGLDQILSLVVLPQLLVWPVFTVVVGLAGAGLAWAFTASPAAPRLPGVPPDVGLAAAEKGR